MKMENLENKTPVMNLKSHILLPVIFILTVAISICFLVVEDFTKDLNAIIVWIFFAVCLAYSVVAIIDTYISKEQKKENQIKFIKVMAILSIVSTISYAIIYLIVK